LKVWRALALPAALLILAEIGARAGGPSDTVAPPSAVFAALLEALSDGSLLVATRDTLFGSVSALDRLTELSVELVRPIPSVAVIPIALVALGFGYRLEIAIVSFACLWPLLVLSRAAVAGVEPRLVEVARVLRLGPFARVFKIIAPAALPRIFVAFRLAAGISLVVAVTVEIAVNPMGLGAGIMTAGQALRPDAMLAYVLWIGLIGFGLNEALTFAQNRLFGQAARTAGEP